MQHLVTHHPDVVQTLSAPNTVKFADADRWLNVIDVSDDGTAARTRFREDGPADFSQIAAAQMIFSEVAAEHARHLTPERRGRLRARQRAMNA